MIIKSALFIAQSPINFNNFLYWFIQYIVRKRERLGDFAAMRVPLSTQCRSANRTLEAQLARFIRVLATRAREGENGP